MTPDQIHALRPDLHRYCARLMGSIVDGEDIVQEALTRALGAGDMSRPLLFRIAHNAAIDALRRHERRFADSVSDLPDAAGNDGGVDPAVVHVALAAFGRLPVAQRSAVILKDVLGCTRRDRWPVAAVERPLVRAAPGGTGAAACANVVGMGMKPRSPGVAIDWETLEHAYGSARDVPALLQQIRDGRAASVEVLANKIAHQGWVSPQVAAATVPSLYAIAAELSGKTKAAVIALLADLACAGDHQHFLGTRITPEANASVVLQDARVAAVRAAVVERASAAAAWLADGSAAVRGATALLLAVTDSSPEEIEARLPRERTSATRFDLLVALGWLTANRAAPLPAVFDDLSSAEDACTRAGAALGAAYVEPLTDERAEQIVAALSFEPVAQSAWAGGRVATLAVEILRHRAQRDDRNDLLVRALGLVDAVAYKQISAGLVKQAFKRDIDEIERDVPRSQRRQYRRPRPPLESLTEEQRATLDLLGQFDGGWGSGCDGRYWLELLGLPQCPPEMREYLGYPPPPPNLLDRVVAIDEFEGPLWRFLPTVCVADGSARARQAALSLVSVIAPDEAVELVILGKRVKVPSAWRGTELFIHHLVAQGKAVVPHLEAALDRFRREGPLGYWGYGIRGGHTPTRNHRYQTGREPLILFIALRVLVPEAPSSWLEGAGHHVSADMLMRNLASFGSEAAAWIDAALAATT